MPNEWSASVVGRVGPQAETTEREARAELDAATSKRAELECQAAAAQSEVDTARPGVCESPAYVNA